MSELFENQTAIVTGVLRGIGSGIATKLPGYGTSVIVNYRSSDQQATEIVDEIDEEGGTAVGVQADVSEYTVVEAIVEATTDRFGSLDILVNNARMTKIGPAIRSISRTGDGSSMWI